MNPYKITAIQLIQNNSTDRQIFIGAIKVKELLDPDHKDRDSRFKIHRWKSNDKSEEKGYQRDPEEGKIKSIKNYLQGEVDEPIFPTTILVNSRKPLSFSYNKKDVGELIIDQPLYIIDGQHRVEAFKDIMEKNELAQKYGFIQLPITILSGFKYKEEVEQFFVINSRHKQIKTDLAQRIYVEISKGDIETGLIKESDKWQMPVITVIDELNKDPLSPWYKLISLPDDDKDIKKERTIAQNSFAKSLKPFFGPNKMWDYNSTKAKNGKQIVEDCKKLINDYWEMIEEVYPASFENKKKSILFKTIGVFSLHIVLAEYISNHPDLNNKEIISKIKKLLIVARDDNKLTTQFWKVGNKIDRERGLNAGAYSSGSGHNRIAISILNQKDIRNF